MGQRFDLAATPVQTSLDDKIARLFANGPGPAASGELVPSKAVRHVPPSTTENPPAPSTPVVNALGPSVMVGGISFKHSATPPGMLEARLYTAIEDLPPHTIAEIFTIPVPPPLPPTCAHTRSSSQKSKGKQPVKGKGPAKKKVVEALSDEEDLAEAIRIANAKTDFTESELKRLLKAPTNKMRDTDQPEGTSFTMKNGTGVMADGETRRSFLGKQGACDCCIARNSGNMLGGEGGRDRAMTSSKQRDILLKSIEVRKAKEFLKAQGRPSDVYVEVEGDSKKATVSDLLVTRDQSLTTLQRKSKDTIASKSREASTSKPKTPASKPKANPPPSQSTSQQVAKTLPTKVPAKSKPFVAVPSSKPSSSRHIFKSKAVISSDEEVRALATTSQSLKSHGSLTGKKSDSDSDNGQPSHPLIDDIAEEAKDDEKSEDTEEEEDEDAVGAVSEETRPCVLPPSPTLLVTTRRLAVGWVHPLAFLITSAFPPSRLATLREVANKQRKDASNRIMWQRQKVAKWILWLERSMIAAEVNKNYTKDIDRMVKWQARNKVDLDFLKTYNLVEEYTVDIEDLENAPEDPGSLSEETSNSDNNSDHE
ncbi:hypothetical protein H0H93_006711 [Arthromyces matolae]|nr:hypothetical protein H0H93_006711 [Arthromyces matolae]